MALALLGTACGRSPIDPGEDAGDEVADTEESTDIDTEESTDTDMEESTDTDAGESTESESESTESESTESESESTESESTESESESTESESESTESESESTESESESETSDPPPGPADPKVCEPCADPWTLDGDLILEDAEPVDLPACLTHITGELRIRSIDDASILSVLEHLQTVDGNVFITHNADAEALPNLSALGCLEHIGGLFFLRYNAFETVDGLEHLHTVGSTLELSYHDNLVSLWGLSALESTGHNFHLQGNPALPSLQGLNALVEVGGKMTIGGCQWSEYDAVPVGLDSLSDLSGLDSLTVVSSLEISANSGLVSLAGAPSLTTVSNDLELHDNEQLDPALIDAFVEGLDVGDEVNTCNSWDPREQLGCGWCSWGFPPQ